MKGKKIIIYIGISGLILALINIFSIIASKKTKNKEEYLFEEPKLKKNKEEIKKKISKYQRILKELNEDEESKLSYRVKIKKENPFFGFFKARKLENKQVKKPINSKKIKKVLKQGIISHRIHESGNEFYEAKIEQTQTIKNGKPIKIILKESIPTLEINSGTELRGIARIQGTRIMLQLTSYIEDGKLKRINLKCYDKADCLEGIYHDDLTKEIEDDLKGKTIDELLDLDFKGSRIGKKANRIVNKRLNSIKLTILKGKELLVSPIIVKR